MCILSIMNFVKGFGIRAEGVAKGATVHGQKKT